MGSSKEGRPKQPVFHLDSIVDHMSQKKGSTDSRSKFLTGCGSDAITPALGRLKQSDPQICHKQKETDPNSQSVEEDRREGQIGEAFPKTHGGESSP